MPKKMRGKPKDQKPELSRELVDFFLARPKKRWRAEQSFSYSRSSTVRRGGFTWEVRQDIELDGSWGLHASVHLSTDCGEDVERLISALRVVRTIMRRLERRGYRPFVVGAERGEVGGSLMKQIDGVAAARRELEWLDGLDLSGKARRRSRERGRVSMLQARSTPPQLVAKRRRLLEGGA